MSENLNYKFDSDCSVYFVIRVYIDPKKDSYEISNWSFASCHDDAIDDAMDLIAGAEMTIEEHYKIERELGFHQQGYDDVRKKDWYEKLKEQLRSTGMYQQGYEEDKEEDWFAVVIAKPYGLGKTWNLHFSGEK